MKKLFKNVLAFSMATTMVVGSSVAANAFQKSGTTTVVLPQTVVVSTPPVFQSGFTLNWDRLDFAAEYALAYKSQPEYFEVSDICEDGSTVYQKPSTVVQQRDVDEFYAYLHWLATSNTLDENFGTGRLTVLQGNGTYVAIYRGGFLINDGNEWNPVLNAEMSPKQEYDIADRDHYILAVSRNARDWTVVGSFYDRIYTGLGLSEADDIDYPFIGSRMAFANGNFWIGAHKYMENWVEPYLLRSPDGINWYKAAVPFSFEILDPERKINGDLGLNNTGDVHLVTVNDYSEYAPQDSLDAFTLETYGTYCPTDANFTNWYWSTTTDQAYYKLANDHDFKYGNNDLIPRYLSSYDYYFEPLGLYDAAMLAVLEVFLPQPAKYYNVESSLVNPNYVR